MLGSMLSLGAKGIYLGLLKGEEKAQYAQSIGVCMLNFLNHFPQALSSKQLSQQQLKKDYCFWGQMHSITEWHRSIWNSKTG